MLWRESHPALHAILLTLYGFSAFAMGDTLAKWLVQSYSVHQILATSSLIGLVCTSGWIMARQGAKGFIPGNLKLHLIRGMVVAFIALFVVNALARLPLADFYGIVFLSPITVLMLSVLFLGEKIGLARLLTVIAGFVGVLIIAGPQFAQANTGIAFALAGMLCASVGSILARKIGPASGGALFSFYPSLLIFCINAPLAAFDFHWPPAPELGLFLVHGAFILMGHFGISLGYARAPEASQVAPFHYVQMLWGIAFGYFLFSDIPSVSTLAGSVLIIGSGLFLIYREHRLHTAARHLSASGTV